jgi:hypothetical protein
MSKERDYMEQSNNFFKKNPGDKVWWLNNGDEVKGEFIFTFDKEKVFNLFADYPHSLTPEQKAIFDEENPYWRDFFRDRQ